MRISDWSSDVCSSDLQHDRGDLGGPGETAHGNARQRLFGEGLRIVRRQLRERAAGPLRFGKAGTAIVDTNVVAAQRAMNRDCSTDNEPAARGRVLGRQRGPPEQTPEGRGEGTK